LCQCLYSDVSADGVANAAANTRCADEQHAYINAANDNSLSILLPGSRRCHFIFCLSYVCLFFFTEALKEYFGQFGAIEECTVMKDLATNRSRSVIVWFMPPQPQFMYIVTAAVMKCP